MEIFRMLAIYDVIVMIFASCITIYDENGCILECKQTVTRAIFTPVTTTYADVDSETSIAPFRSSFVAKKSNVLSSSLTMLSDITVGPSSKFALDRLYAEHRILRVTEKRQA